MAPSTKPESFNEALLKSIIYSTKPLGVLAIISDSPRCLYAKFKSD